MISAASLPVVHASPDEAGVVRPCGSQRGSHTAVMMPLSFRSVPGQGPAGSERRQASASVRLLLFSSLARCNSRPPRNPANCVYTRDDACHGPLLRDVTSRRCRPDAGIEYHHQCRVAFARAQDRGPAWNGLPSFRSVAGWSSWGSSCCTKPPKVPELVRLAARRPVEVCFTQRVNQPMPRSQAVRGVCG